MRIFVKIIKHRAGRDAGSENKDDRMLPVALEKILVGHHEEWYEENENEWRETEGDIGMEAETEYESGKKKIDQLSGPQPAEEEIKGEGEEKRCHDGAESDTGEIDGPVGCGGDKSRYQTRETPLEEFPGEKSDPEGGQGSEDGRPEFECRDIDPEGFERESLEIDEESLSSGIVFVKKPVVACLIGDDRIGTVHRLVGVESGGKAFYVIEAEEKSENDYRSEAEEHRRDAMRVRMHNELFVFLVL